METPNPQADSGRRAPSNAPAWPKKSAAHTLVCFLLVSTIAIWASAATKTGAGGSESLPDSITAEQIADALEAHVQEVRDVSATVTFVQVAARDGSRMEGEVELAAILPDLVRATWRKPDYLAGVIWILDAERNQFTQYLPASGEATRLPLDKTLEQQGALPFTTPQDLFTLPPRDRFDLAIVGGGESPHLVQVRANSKDANQAYLLLVDTSKWLVTQFQSLNAKGIVEFTANARNIQVNQSLEAADLRRLPPGAIERSYP